MVERLLFPRKLAVTLYTATLWQEGIGEDGAPLVHSTVRGLCIFSEHAKRTVDKDGKTITLNGRMMVEGDLAPALPTIAAGEVVIGDKHMQIHAGHRPRNPNGTVHHTTLELI
jgi:hypothetical protein